MLNHHPFNIPIVSIGQHLSFRKLLLALQLVLWPLLAGYHWPALAEQKPAVPEASQQAEATSEATPNAEQGPAAGKEASYAETCVENDFYCHRFVKARTYFKELNPDATDQEWLEMEQTLRPFTDPELLSKYLADPEEFASWMISLSDPDTVHLMMRCSQEPIMWNSWLKVFTNPEIVAKSALPLASPATYMRWGMAPMNLNVYKSLAPLLTSSYYADWGRKLSTPTFYEPAYAWLNPQWTVDRLAWALNSQTYANMFRWFNQPAIVPARPSPPTTEPK